ncbi:MAG: glycosyltransferase family 39 protein [Cyanobacteria bacterium P01_A01_bin.45]
MKNRVHLLLLLIWLSIGIVLRFIQLEVLPPWTDECATIVFSLGNSFRTVPLNQIISSDTLLEPLRFHNEVGLDAVFKHLFAESTHPPVYFVLTHLWMKFFSSPGEIISIWTARSLSAFLGVVSIPAMFGFAYLVFRSLIVAHVTAAIMAVSPYAVFLAREARHYTLSILLVIASICCLVKALEVIYRQQVLPLWIGCTWIAVNIIGMANHYFFSLTLCIEGFVLLWEIWKQNNKSAVNSSYVRVSVDRPSPVTIQFLLKKLGKSFSAIVPQRNQRRIWIVFFATSAGCLVWLPFLRDIQGSSLTNWVSDGTSNLIEPLWRLLMWGVSMFYLVPSATILLPLWVEIFSGAIMLLFLLWILPYIKDGWKYQQNYSSTENLTKALSIYLNFSIILFLVFTYILDIDLTLAPRFQFVYFPILILLVTSSLVSNWKYIQDKLHKSKHLIPRVNGKFIIGILWLMGLIGGVTVVHNIGYLQHHRADLMAPIIQEASQAPTLIVTSHKHHGQTGRMMGLAWEMNKLVSANSGNKWQFFLAHKDKATDSYDVAIEILQNQISKMSRPFDLWLINFRTGIDLDSAQCLKDQNYSSSAGEYRYKLYRCKNENLSSSL